MRYNQLASFADIFYSLATKEKLPDNSKDLKIILKNIENLETYSARTKYAEKNLKRLSSGSSRIVYLTPEKTVVKMAKNDRGIAQNKAESNPKMKSKYINSIISKAKNNSWIETHFLDKITEKEFEKMTKLKFEDFGDAIRYGLKDVSGNSNKKPAKFEQVSKSDIYKNLINIGEKFKLMGGDLARISSWGCKDNHPIILDSGLTKEVFDDFYEDSSS